MSCSLKLACAARVWQAAQLAALPMDGRFQAAGSTSRCSRTNQGARLMRSFGGGVGSRATFLKLPALLAS